MVFGGVGWGLGGVVVPMGGEDTGVTSAAEKGATEDGAEHGFCFLFFCIFFLMWWMLYDCVSFGRFCGLGLTSVLGHDC